VEPSKSRQGTVALAFAEKLVAGDYEAAHSMLASPLRENLSAAQLKGEYERMIEYGDGPPDFMGVVNILEEWPAKQEGDVGWAYVAISGGDYSEAVAVVVAQEAGQFVIREIEWGRP
jgi:hypothetical protein